MDYVDIIAKLEAIEEKLDLIIENQEQQAEALANVSTPGGNFSVFEAED